MATVPGDIIRASAVFVHDQRDNMVNVYHFIANTVAATEADFIDDCIQYIETIYVPWSSHRSNLSIPANVTLYNVTQDVLIGIFPWATLAGGGASGDQMPNAICPFAYARTGIKKARGRKFFPTTGEQYHANNSITGAIVANIAIGVSNWAIQSFTGTNNSILHPGVLVNQTNPVIVGFERFTNSVLKTVTAIQRRRKPGIGA